MMNAETTEETDFTEVQRKRIDAAYAAWQFEENCDRGYNFDLCQKLRDEYYAVIDDATKENLQAVREMEGGDNA